MAPRVAARLGVGAIADAVGLTRDGEAYSVRRPVYSGKAFATVCCDGSSPMCYPLGEFRVGSSDVLLGETGEPWMTQRLRIQAPYLRDFADWLDDDAKPHSCRVDIAYRGYETLMAMCLAALDHTRVDLPLADPAASDDLFERMRREIERIRQSFESEGDE